MNRRSSQKQLEQQARFSVSVKFVRSMQDLFMETYKQCANEMTGANTGLADLLKRSIAGTFPTYSILYTRYSLAGVVCPMRLRPLLQWEVIWMRILY